MNPQFTALLALLAVFVSTWGTLLMKSRAYRLWENGVSIRQLSS